MSDLEIFQLAGAIALALKGEKEAIADVELLLKRHPEMFKNVKDVVNTINEVVKEPEIIMDNPSISKYPSKNEILSAKKLDDKKMGDVGIRNDNGTNVIFHANKKKISEFKRLEAKQQTVGSPSSYTQAQSLDGLVQKNSSSVVSEPIIPQNSEKKPFKPTGKHKNSKDKDIER
ncbi:hypothetical protein CRU92_00770 [Arcobacter sp. FW59]|nr:hypothetical protein CRU92_00770 [Arcobacter sp. FW59]